MTHTALLPIKVRALALLFAVFVTACGDGDQPIPNADDAGTDAGREDSGAGDAGPKDAGDGDAGGEGGGQGQAGRGGGAQGGNGTGGDPQGQAGEGGSGKGGSGAGGVPQGQGGEGGSPEGQGGSPVGQGGEGQGGEGEDPGNQGGGGGEPEGGAGAAGEGGGGDPAPECSDTEALEDGVCVCLPGHFGEGCAPCGCPEDTECQQGKSGDGSCLAEKLVECKDDAPTNGHSLVELVTITYSDESGWSEPAACDFECDLDYYFYEPWGECINEGLTLCTNVAPPHASSVYELVTITYTTAGGWTEPAACDWNCHVDWFETSDVCINSRPELCIDQAPPNGLSYPAWVNATYTTAGGWVTPACEWICNDGFREVDGACDTTPAIIASTPEDGGITPDGTVIIDFSESMNTASIEQGLALTPDVDFTHAWSNSNRRLTITVDGPFPNQQGYAIGIDGGEDLEGNALTEAFSLSFHGTAWVMLYGSTETTTGNLIARATDLGLPDSDARTAANALCGAEAFASVPEGCSELAAFLSVSPSDQVKDLVDLYDLSANSQVLGRNGALLENQWTGLFDGVLGTGTVASTLSQNGTFPLGGPYLYWTGSNVDGTFNSQPPETACNGWTEGTVSFAAQHGWASDANENWIHRAAIACQNTLYLLCVCW